MTTCTCMGCGGDLTSRNPHTFAICVSCEQREGFEPFERGQQVRVRLDYVGETPGLAGELGYITGRFPGGNFEVALRPKGWGRVQPFALWPEALEPGPEAP